MPLLIYTNHIINYLQYNNNFIIIMLLLGQHTPFIIINSTIGSGSEVHMYTGFDFSSSSRQLYHCYECVCTLNLVNDGWSSNNINTRGGKKVYHFG